MLTNSASLHCVKCGQLSLVKEGEKAYRCQSCHFVYFHNVAAAVCAVIVCHGKMLLVERAQQPAKGKLDFPGGFVDYNESNEQALKRELMEELCLPVNDMQYLFSYPNQYLYKDVLYSTLDNFFKITLSSMPELVLQQEEVSRYQWLDVQDVDKNQLAFSSGRHGFSAFLHSLDVAGDKRNSCTIIDN